MGCWWLNWGLPHARQDLHPLSCFSDPLSIKLKTSKQTKKQPLFYFC